MGERLPGPHPLAKCNQSLLKCGLTAFKIAKIGIFWYKFAQKGYTPEAIFIKFGLGEGLPSPHPCAKFNHCNF